MSKKSAIGIILGMMNVFLFMMWVIVGAITLFESENPSQLEYFCILIALLAYIGKDTFSFFYFN